MKKCKVCNLEKDVKDFHISKTTSTKIEYKNVCKECNKVNSKSLNSIKKEIPSLYRKRCAICSGEDDLCYDHDHSTNHFRGFLCRNCNTALGKFNDNIELLKRAIDYLEQSMKIINHDGKEIKIDLKNAVSIDDNRPRSSLHLEARKLLKSLFPSVQICEEVSINMGNGKTVFLDFFIPSILLAIEVNGEQHFKFVPFFHKTKAAFIKAQQLDKDKKELCKMNNFYFISLNYNEDIETWKAKIENR